MLPLAPKLFVGLHKVEFNILQLIYLHLNTSQYNEHDRMGAKILGAWCPGRINFAGWSLISVGPERETCFTSRFCCHNFEVTPTFLEKLCRFKQGNYSWFKL